MGAAERRTSELVDLVGDLLARPLAAFPHREVSGCLDAMFGCHVGWSHQDPDGPPGLELHRPIPGWPTPEVLADVTGVLMDHPVMHWMVVTGDLRPMTIGRVPPGLVTGRGRRMVREHLCPIGAEEQLAITYRFGATGLRAFVLGRTGGDFSDEDLRVATALQSLLILLDRQVSTCADAHEHGDLTARELAVVRLLAEGRTAAGIAVRLAISERTVHRHLQGAYRKLGAHDRVTAVLAAREAGIV